MYTRNARNVFKQLEKIEQDAISNIDTKKEKARLYLKKGNKK